MERNERRILFRAGMVWAAAPFLLAGCRGAEKMPERLKVGVSIYRDDDTYINSIVAEMKQLFQENYAGEALLNIVSAKNSQNDQDEQVERFLSLGYDVICVNAVDRTDVGRMVDLAMEAEVPLIFFNREPVDDDLYRGEDIYYVGSDAQESARLQGRMIAEAWEENREELDLNGDGVLSFALLEGERGHQDAVIRTEWVIRSLEEAGVPWQMTESGVADWERDQAAALSEQWLSLYGDQIELFICNNDDMALGVLDTLKKESGPKIGVVGIDGTEEALAAVEKGELLGTVSADREGYAGALIEMSLNLARGKELPGEMDTDGKKVWIPWEIKSREDSVECR